MDQFLVCDILPEILIKRLWQRTDVKIQKQTKRLKKMSFQEYLVPIDSFKLYQNQRKNHHKSFLIEKQQSNDIHSILVHQKSLFQKLIRLDSISNVFLINQPADQYPLLIRAFHNTTILQILHSYMASIIQQAIQKFMPDIEKIQKWEQTSQQHKAASLRLDKIGESFLSTIILLICNDEKLESMTQKVLQRKVNEFMNFLCQQRKIKIDYMKKILGKIFEDQFTSNESLRDLKEQLEVRYDNDIEIDIKEDMHNTSLDEEESIHNFLQSLNNSPDKTWYDMGTFDPPEKLVLGDSEHEKKVVGYLMEISSPQTQLTYLCQSMGWKLKFQDQFATDSNSIFEVIVSVDFQFRKVEQRLVEKFKAKQKKQGKTVASFKMLRRIYLSFPQIWELYDQKRIKKALVVEKNPSIPIQLVPQEILMEKVEPISTKYEKDETFLKEKNVYLQNIASFKSQLNLLNQQNPGIFMFKFDKEKVQNSNFWKVKGELIANFRGDEKTFQCIQQNLNSKVGEEQAARKLIQKVYDAYIDLFKKMSMIKQKKCIKT